MKKIKEFKVLLLVVFLIGFIIDIFFFPVVLDVASDLRLFFIVFLWLFIVKASHFSSRATFKIALLFLILLSVLFFFSTINPQIERIASWIYIFLLIGIIQQFFETGKTSRVRR